jgi:hypothetical protein
MHQWQCYMKYPEGPGCTRTVFGRGDQQRSSGVAQLGGEAK